MSLEHFCLAFSFAHLRSLSYSSKDSIFIFSYSHSFGIEHFSVSLLSSNIVLPAKALFVNESSNQAR